MGCGGGTASVAPSAPSYTPEPLVVADFLLSYGREHASILEAPEGDLAALEAKRGEAAPGAPRREVFAEIAVFHLLASLATEGDEPTRARELRKAERSAGLALRRNRDDALAMRVDYLKIWTSWQADRDNAAGRAERFIRAHADSGELHTLAWILRAEVAVQDEQWGEAIDAYRYVLGQLGHPLYGYALYRSAIAHRNAAELEEAAQAFGEARDLGCATNAAPETIRAAALAAMELEERVELDPSGVPRPALCAEREPVAAHGGDEPPPVHLD